MSPPDSLRWRLRAATSGTHARVDALVGPALEDVDRYVAFLRGMQRVLAAARTVLDDDRLAAHERALREDLRSLGAQSLPPAAGVVADDSPGVRLGWRYVLAGSSLGARLLLRRAQALGFGPGHGARYLAAHAGGGDWARLLAELGNVPEDDRLHDEAIAAARSAFELVEQAMLEALETAPA